MKTQYTGAPQSRQDEPASLGPSSSVGVISADNCNFAPKTASTVSRIGIVAVSHEGLGGTYQYTLSMIDALRKIPNYDCIIYTDAENRSYDDLGLPVRRLPGTIGTLVRIAGFRLLGVAGLFGEVDKVIAPIYSPRLLAASRPFVFTLHDLQERYFPGNFSFAQRLWRRLNNTSLAHSAARIICESRCVREDIQKFLNVPGSKVVIIQAPPVAAFQLERLKSEYFETLLRTIELPSEYLLYPAQYFPHKNHMRLVDAFAQVTAEHPSCHLLLTGQKRYEFDKVDSRVRKLGLDRRVRYLGQVDTDTLAATYLRATGVVIPTLFESISIPVYEAFRLGVPVCASNVVALPEQIGDAGLLFDPLSVDDMAEKISELLGDAELRQRLAQRGRQRIEKLTSDHYAERLAELLEEMR